MKTYELIFNRVQRLIKKLPFIHHSILCTVNFTSAELQHVILSDVKDMSWSSRLLLRPQLGVEVGCELEVMLVEYHLLEVCS